MKQICRECKSLKSVEDFALRNKKNGKRATICKSCHNTRMREHYASQKKYYVDKF